MDIVDVIRQVFRHEMNNVINVILFIVVAYYGVKMVSEKINEYFSLEEQVKKQNSYMLYKVQRQNDDLNKRLEYIEDEVDDLFYEDDEYSDDESTLSDEEHSPLQDIPQQEDIDDTWSSGQNEK